MPLLRDVHAARKVLTGILRSRKSRAELARRLPDEPPIEPGSIEIAVYFADTRVNMYQIRQWYAPLAELAKRRPVAIISRSPGVMLNLLDESPVPAVYLRPVVDLERFVQKQNLKIVFYVNQNTKNFQMFRYGTMWHVFINHGESDKMYMTTNQFKAYDYSLVAGEAARQRLRRKLWNFDVDRRAITIGRPQADHFVAELPYPADDRTVVLYAPTWEGDRAAAAYGSIATHGVALVDALIATGRHRVLYRPHPRSGVIDREYKRANESIIAAIAAANAADATAHHIFDEGNELGWQIAGADVAITDVSAMVYDRLATGKPLIVARPTSPLADVDESGYLGDCEWLTADAAGNIVEQAERVLHSVEAKQKLNFWVERHFGDTTQGAATARFHAAVEQLVREWEHHSALHAADVAVSSTDAFDDDDDEDTVDAD